MATEGGSAHAASLAMSPPPVHRASSTAPAPRRRRRFLSCWQPILVAGRGESDEDSGTSSENLGNAIPSKYLLDALNQVTSDAWVSRGVKEDMILDRKKWKKIEK